MGTMASMKSAKRGGRWALLSRGGSTARQRTYHLMHANVFDHRQILTNEIALTQKSCSGACDTSFCLEERGIGPSSHEVKKCRSVTMAENRGLQRVKPQSTQSGAPHQLM